ncbi:PREDICTED: nuclear fragile X mental retardation-interacting protein 1-like isoform X2 [Polistes dominula]|uniref:Nuclear fragile X mental retardation-interacting protein 1-like isoform X2 n=1 Tax=Polistes dominula TaxID=743375 RepID=A0ABM1IDJ8_POLDO|nr:PREDICTED: nuclear fragile X mental retardation-interacting protein 1-like isoform X2 [Polistes dominula]
MTRGNMSPVNRSPSIGPRIPPPGVRPLPHPRFGAIFPPGMPPRMPLPPMSGILGPMRPRLPPPCVAQPGGPPRPLLPPGRVPLPPPMPGPRGPPIMCPWPRRVLPPQMVPHMRPRFSPRNGTKKATVYTVKKVVKYEDLELKKPWMTDEIRSEIQKKNKLYAKAKKNKDAKEWGEFKDIRNKVTRMIRDAKNDYLAKHPEQAHIERNMETKESNKESSCDKIDENNEVNKVDKVYYCEVCDREFKTEDKLTEHVSMHKICGIDGCTFSANVLLVDKHIKMQHRTGLYERMKNVSTPEDITKWIEDRKRKYPTKAKAEKKQKADDMKNIEHGETSNRVNKPIIHSRKNKQQQQQQTNTNNVVKKPKRTFRIQKKQNTTTTDVETYRGLIQFPGTACLKDIKCNESENTNDEQLKTTKCINESEQLENTFNISDEEDTTMENNSIANLTNPMKNIFMNSLVADYGSEEEEEEEGKENDECPEEVPIKKFANHSNETNIMETTVSSNNTKSNDTSNKSDKKKKKKEKEIEKEKEKENKPLSIQNKVIDKQKKYKNSSSINLLRKLLAKPIKNERNLIYQCIKYIESNNFLNV